MINDARFDELVDRARKHAENVPIEVWGNVFDRVFQSLIANETQMNREDYRRLQNMERDIVAALKDIKAQRAQASLNI